MECECCGQETDCEECDGTGLNDALLDVKAFNEAADELFRESGMTWLWVENNTALGRASRKGRVAYADYARTKPAEGA